MKPEVSLDFMPSFYTHHLGVKFGRNFYYDPEYRAKVQRQQSLFLYDQWGEFGVGSTQPEPVPSLFIQPIEVIMRTQGAEWRFPEDATLESWGTPWMGLGLLEIQAIDPLSAAHHPVVEELLNQYRELTRMYGERADLFGIKTGLMNIHTPLTTAHQLIGEDLFLMLMEDPHLVDAVFSKVWDLYEAVFGRLAGELGAAFQRVQLGDCSASMLSRGTYETLVLPWNSRIASRFAFAGYHSCGASSHLLPAFSKIENVSSFQLGPGTDLRAASEKLQGRHLEPLVDPVIMRQADADTVSNLIAGMIDDCATAPKTTVCLWSLDRDTPIDNVSAVYQLIEPKQDK